MIVGATAASTGHAAESLTLAQLLRQTHVHGLAVDRQDSTRLLVATHDGFFAVSPDGRATLISANRDDFMGFTPHPADPAVLYASGHPERGGNLGVVWSADGGRTWRQLAKGVNGPVDFHQMDVSKADPRMIYGVFAGLQVSKDGGNTWTVVGPAPAKLIDLAASPSDPQRLYAATEEGLLLSRDGGRSWRAAHVLRRPATVVETTAGGVYAFILGAGLLSATEPDLNWTTLNNRFGDAYLLHLAVDPADKNNLFVATHRGELLASTDGGRTWAPLGGR